MARLIYKQPNGEIKEFRIGAQPVTVGRGTQVDLQLPDERVSRMHFGVRLQDSQYVIKDLHSTNGTFVNGDRLVEARVLADHDQLTVGNSQLEFCIDPTDKG